MSTESARQEGAPAPHRILTRAIAAFFMELMGVVQALGEGDVDAGSILLLLAYVETEHVPFERSDDTDPAARAISVASLAYSTCLTAETARRRVGSLIRRGVVVRQGKAGVMLDASFRKGALLRDAHLGLLKAFDGLIKDLEKVGFLLPEGLEPRGYDQPSRRFYGAPERFAIRVQTRLLSDFMDLLRPYSDLTDALLYWAVLHENTKELAETPRLAWRFDGANAAPPDRMRRPVSLRTLSQTLSLPYETTRRRVARLETLEVMKRERGGVIVSAAATQRPDFILLGVRMHHGFGRMLAELAQTR